MKKVILFGAFLIQFCACLTKADETSKAKAVETKALMQQLVTQLTNLKEYFTSEDKFKDPKNDIAISIHLKEFARLAKLSQHDPRLKEENFKFSRHVLEEHIVDTERTFRLGNKSYARWQLVSTVAVCMNCHTQMPGVDRSFDTFLNAKSFSSDFDRAEFLFATREFERANSLFDKMIEEYPKSALTITQLETALERQVAFYSRVKRDPKLALAVMNSHQKNKEIPEYLALNIKAWISQFEDWDKHSSPNPRSSSAQEVLDFTKKNILLKPTRVMMEATNPNLVTYLRVSSVIYEYLQNHPEEKTTPEFLYWLSICERATNSNFFYSLADLYLRECIIKYPKEPIAKKCFAEYEDQMILGYSGSSGTHLPPEVTRDLEQLKTLVNKESKLEMREH